MSLTDIQLNWQSACVFFRVPPPQHSLTKEPFETFGFGEESQNQRQRSVRKRQDGKMN